MAELAVEISGDIKKLEKALGAAEKDLKGFNQTAKGFSSGFSKSTSSAAKSMNSFRKGTISGDAAMTSFSRTIQDAPFGIMGVSNNITNLTEQFGYLKNKTGSAKGALGAMLKSLKGFGGISLAISAVTSLLLVFGDEIFSTKKKVDALVESTKGLIGTIGKETSVLNSLLAVARDEEQSKEKRIKAVRKINELYPNYLGNLKLEGVNSKTTSEQVDLLTKSLIKQATVKGLLNRISEVAAKKFEAEQKKAEEYITTGNKIGSTLSYLFSTNETYTTSFGKGSKTRQEAIKKEDSLINSLQASIVKILKTNNLDFDALFGGSSGGSGSKSKVRVKQMFVGLTTEMLLGVEKFNQISLENPLKPPVIDPAPVVQSMVDLDYQLTELIGGSIASTFSQLGTVIGEALSQGGDVLAAAGQTIVQGLGSLLSAMGTKLIELGTAAVLAGTVTKLFGSIAGIGAGFAAIAGGTLLKAAGSAISSFGGAGNNSGSVSNDTGGSSYQSNSSYGGASFSSGGMQNVVFEIQGTKLVGVLSNTLRRNSNLGGNLQITT